MILTNEKNDTLGALASSLCLVHCIATPFVFIAQSCTKTCCSSTPIWWSFIDYLFLIISFIAVYRSTQTTSENWIKPALWSSWSLLFFVIVNEKVQWFHLDEFVIYFPALALVGLHLYNKKYCQCNNNTCCSN